MLSIVAPLPRVPSFQQESWIFSSEELMLVLRSLESVVSPLLEQQVLASVSCSVPRPMLRERPAHRGLCVPRYSLLRAYTIQGVYGRADGLAHRLRYPP